MKKNALKENQKYLKRCLLILNISYYIDINKMLIEKIK